MPLPWTVCEVGFDCKHPNQIFEEIASLLPKGWIVSGFYLNTIYFEVTGILTQGEGEFVKSRIAELDLAQEGAG